MWEIWAKIIVAEGFKKWPKVQKIAQSGHTGCGSVGRVVDSDSRGPQFKSSHRQKFMLNVCLLASELKR